MSIEAQNYVWGLTNLTPTKKLILLCLANFADIKNQSWPSYGYIADKVGLKDPKSVQRLIKELVDIGLLEKKARFIKNKGQTSNIYTLTMAPHLSEEAPSHSLRPPNTKEDTKDKYIQKFNIFWSVYPRKINKKGAHKSFCKFATTHHDKILYGAQRFAEDSTQTEIKFIPHATTWLNQERWLDYFETDEAGRIDRTKKNKTLNNLAG